MTPIQEMVIALFSDDIIERAKKQAKAGPEIIHIERFDMSFRLLKVDYKTINLEFLVSRKFGSQNRLVTYFKPIGVYTVEKSLFSSKISIKIIFEFEKHYGGLAGNAIPKIKYEVNKFTFEENIVIAAFSMDAVSEASKMQDSNLKINGLDMEIVMAFDGYPQIFLDDSYNIKGPIAAYFIENPQSLNPMINYKKTFDELDSKKLLSAYN